MSRLFSIIVTLFILVLVYLWIGHITGRDDTNESSAPEVVMTDSQRDMEEGTLSEDSDKDILQEEPENEGQEESTQDEGASETKDEQEEPLITSSQGDHLVIVGNFLERSNAEKHLATVKGLGYPSAEILQFEISQYYTVCAGRYTHPTEARRVAKRIKEQHGIDAYMRTVN